MPYSHLRRVHDKYRQENNENCHHHHQGRSIARIPLTISFFPPPSLSHTLNPSMPVIAHCQVLLTAPRIHTELLNVSFCWLDKTGVSMCRSPYKEGHLWVCPYFPNDCTACLTWMVCKMGNEWLYSCCFVGCILV